VFRSISRTAAVALAIAATAAPTAQAQDRISPDAADAGGQAPPISRVTPDASDAGRSQPSVERVTPDAQDAAQPEPKVDRVSPDARDNGRREAAPIVIDAPPMVVGDRFDWLDAGIGAAVLALVLVGSGAALTLRTRRHTAGV
jgi:hypothetical protein